MRQALECCHKGWGESTIIGVAGSVVDVQASLAGQSASDNRMNAYLLRHYQATGSTGGKGFVTFVPIVVRASTVEAKGGERSDGASPDDTPGESTDR